MTDRLHALTVTLVADARTDDAAPLIEAIKQLRGVLDVRGEISDIATHTAMMRARHELREKIVAILYPENPK